MKLASLVARVTAVALITVGAAGCSSKSDKTDKQVAANPPAAPAPAPTPAAPPPPAAAPAPAAPVETGPVPADFPPECVEYAGLIDKLKTCDKIGAARDGLMQGYTGLRAGWAAVPAEQRAGVAVQCKTQADSLRAAAAATCGW
jgi:hypothetical protein